jgi:hypothetical protein
MIFDWLKRARMRLMDYYRDTNSSSSAIINPVEGERVLLALKLVETSNSTGGGIRFEPSWMPPGYTFVVQGKLLTGTGKSLTSVGYKRWNQWGIWSAASYSPWQILYQLAADLGYQGHPCGLADPMMAEQIARKRLSDISRDLQVHGKQISLRNIADAWNSGNACDGIVPADYITKFEAAYSSIV